MTTAVLTEEDFKFQRRLQSTIQTVKAWDADVDLIQKCRSQIPWDELRDRDDHDHREDHHGKYSKPEDRMLQGNALLLQRLSRWFQKSMTWVNSPPCSQCGNKNCQGKGSRGPETDEEKNGQASRVEVYQCPQCNDTTTTFPRYNSVRKLLETKQGRCGEYANLFGLVCRAAGFETRYVLDVTDHVWTEVRVQDHWIMADGCEGVVDQPSMYQHGWGKQGLCYMVAIGIDHMVDVTPRYTRHRPYDASDELQSLRRAHTSSEQASQTILKQLNTQLQQGLPKSRVQELARRMKLEEMELQHSKQATEWTPQERHGGCGRMSGSLAWTQSRGEAGQKKNGDGEKKNESVSGFQIESFASSPQKDKVTITVRPHPTSRHEGICISGTACAVGELKSISVVVLDEAAVGCILQSRSFDNYQDLQTFMNTVPTHRIVVMNGMCSRDDDDDDTKSKSMSLSSRLGGWKGIPKDSQGFLYVGQVDAQPDWVYCATYEECQGGYEVELAMPPSPGLRLRTERQVVPQLVAGRLPESTMPLSTQLLATEEQKRIAFTSFSASNKRYSGYATKVGAPVYLLDARAYPLQRMEQADPKESWNTFHFLPSPLVPEDDHGIVETAKGSPMYHVPLEIDFFTSMLGSQLLVGNNNTLQTSQALQNARLVGLYFSAHWCGPCRQYTPILAEMYEHLKEEYPSHGLEIVFVSSDRDQGSFEQYYGSMPWQAVPFQNVQMLKHQLSMTYGVRGIPALVILDAVSGQIVVPASQSRQEVMTACQGGDLSIETMLASWLERTPPESLEILSMLELSCQEDTLKKGSGNDKISSYLVREKPAESKTKPDTAARVKEIFTKLVQEGSEPTAAAAKAIEMVVAEQKKPSSPKLEPGPLNGKAARTGPPLKKAVSVDEAVAQVVEWHSVDQVRTVLSTAVKYLSNTKKEPWTPKFRTFKLSNKVADQITRVEAGLRLLESLGFEVYGTSQDFMATIPLIADLDAMEKQINRILENL